MTVRAKVNGELVEWNNGRWIYVESGKDVPSGEQKKLVMTSEELVSMKNDFAKKVEPKKVMKADELYLFRCPECGGVHFRHAGYVELLMPFIRADGTKSVGDDSYAVQVCTQCRQCFIWLNEQMYDVTELIDLEAWIKLEQEMHEATGPGGEC